MAIFPDDSGSSHDCGFIPHGLVVKENPENGLKPAKKDKPKIPFKSILKRSSFYYLAIGSMCSIGAVSGLSQNLKLFFSIDLKYSQGEAANIISLVLGSQYYRAINDGLAGRPVSQKKLMILIYFLISGSILLLYFASTPGVIYLFAFIFGIGLGGDYMIIPLMAAELFGVKVLGRVMGLILSVDGLGEAFGPILAGGFGTAVEVIPLDLRR